MGLSARNLWRKKTQVAERRPKLPSSGREIVFQPGCWPLHRAERATCFIPDLIYVGVWTQIYLFSARSLCTGILQVAGELSKYQPNGEHFQALGLLGGALKEDPGRTRALVLWAGCPLLESLRGLGQMRGCLKIFRKKALPQKKSEKQNKQAFGG